MSDTITLVRTGRSPRKPSFRRQRRARGRRTCCSPCQGLRAKRCRVLRPRDLHDAIQSLLTTLNICKPERDGQARLPGQGGSFVRLSLAAKDRALLILDAVAKALAVRGHQLHFVERKSNYQPHKLIAVVNDIEVQMGIVEPLLRSEHRRSPEEEARFKRTGYSWGPAYDFTPSGQLIFSMGGYSGTSYKWSDGARKKLEEQLGEVVLSFVDEAVRVVAARVADEERRVREHEEQRARDVVKVRANYEAALVEDLERMAEQHRRATTIRDFLRALENAVETAAASRATSATRSTRPRRSTACRRRSCKRSSSSRGRCAKTSTATSIG